MNKIPTKYYVAVLRKRGGRHICLGDIHSGTGGHREHDDREHQLVMLTVLKQKSDTRN